MDQITLVGDGRKFIVAIVVPDFEQLEKWGRTEGLDFADAADLAGHPAAAAHLLEEMKRELDGFADYEKPKRVLLLDEEFSIENGTLTPTQKVRRKAVSDRYADRIEAVYEEAEKESTRQPGG